MNPSFPNHDLPYNGDEGGFAAPYVAPPRTFQPPLRQKSSSSSFQSTTIQPNYIAPNSPSAGASYPSTGLPGQFGASVDGVLANPMAQMAMGSAQKMAKDQMSYVLRLISAHRLKYYFTVDNWYVLNKIKIVLCPLLHSKWAREGEDISHHGMGFDPSEVQYKPPKDDVNAPDLYIPTMAFVTYTLLMGYTLGTFGEFTPEVLGMTASSTLVTLLIEVCLLKMGFYLTSSVSPSMLDLAAYCSYKNVGMVVEMVVALVFGNLAFYVAVLVCGLSSALFMMKTLKREMAHTVSDEDGKRRMLYFLFIVGGMQIIFSFFMVITVARSPLPVASSPP